MMIINTIVTIHSIVNVNKWTAKCVHFGSDAGHCVHLLFFVFVASVASVNTSIIINIVIRSASGKEDFTRHFHLYTQLLVIVVIPCNTGWK